MAQTTKLKIEEKELLFTIEIKDCTFNAPGSFYLKLTIDSVHEEAANLLKQVKVCPGDDIAESIEGFSIVTDTVEVSETKQSHNFINNHFTFHLPKGLCSASTDRKVNLLVRLFPYNEDDGLTDDITASNPVDIGHAEFVIYPRTSTPVANLSATGSDDLYDHSGTLNLRTTDNGLAVLAGRLSYLLRLRVDPTPEPEQQLEPEPSPSPPPERPEPPTPEGEPLAQRSPPPLRPKTVPEPLQNPTPQQEPIGQPRREFNPRRGSEILRQSHVANPNQEDLVVIVHAATNLPRLLDGSTPRAYVTGVSEDATGVAKHGVAATHAAKSASFNPTWEEAIIVTVPIDKGESGNQTTTGIKLQVINEPDRSAILEFPIPLSLLQPFHQYHLQLVLGESQLFISTLRRSSQLTRLDDGLLQSQDALGFHGLEVLLLGVQEPLANPIGPLIAVARLIPDLLVYRQQATDSNIQGFGLVPIAVQYPDPHPSSFLVSQDDHSHPQVSLVGLPEDQPAWHHAFLFTKPRELASIFTDIAALALQFFPATSAFSDNSWSLQDPSAHCTQLLDTRVYQALASPRGRMGVRIELPLQGHRLECRDTSTPRVSIIIRLVTSMRPDSLATTSDPNSLPSLQTFFEHEVKSPPADQPSTSAPTPPLAATPPSPARSLHPMRTTTPLPVPLYPARHRAMQRRKVVDDDYLPSHDAIHDLLPSTKRRQQQSRHSDGGIIPVRLPPSPDSYSHRDRNPKPNSAPTDGYDKYTVSMMDAQQKEIGSYREALKRMGEEIVRMQEQISQLEDDNSKLRQRINMHEDAAKAMIASDDLDDVTKSELLEKYMVIRQKLSRQITETSVYRDKLLQLQNDMIKQNDREQLYLKQQNDQSALTTTLQDRQVKIKKLERTCREQEKALDKMERLLGSKQHRNSTQQDVQKLDATHFMAENVRLKAQIEQLQTDSSSKTSRNNDGEKLMMQLQMEKAKSRVQSLERELMEKAREWGKEKESLRLRMGEQHRSYNQRALPPLHDRSHNHYSDEDADHSYNKGLRQGTPPYVSHRYF